MRIYKTVSISLHPEVLKKLDELCKENDLEGEHKPSRSEIISTLIEYVDLLHEMGILSELFDKIRKLPKEQQYEKFHKALQTIDILA